MPRQTRHDWLLAHSRTASRRATAWRSADRYDRRLRLEPLEERRLLALVTVTNTLDVVNGNTSSIAALIAGDGGDGVSLREAIQAANVTAGADEITFATALTGTTITLSGTQLEITEALMIDARPLAENVTIDANLASRIFHITATTGDFTLAGLTLTGGRTTASGFVGGGGAIRSGTNGHFTLDQSTVSGNITTGGSTTPDGIVAARGGGIFAIGAMTLTQSTVSGNSTTGFGAKGGGIAGYLVTLTGSTVSGNSTTGGRADGGGIAGFLVTLTGSTVSGNSTAGSRAYGGGIFANGAMTLTQSTVSENVTTGINAHGGGISAVGAMTLTQSTVSGNSTAGFNSDGGGIFALSNVVLNGSTVSGNVTTGNDANGGGIYSRDTMTLTQSTVSENVTTGIYADGGGISAVGAMTLTQSTVSGNSTAGINSDGGGIYSSSTVRLTGSTVSGNVTTENNAAGGGIWAGEVQLTQSTVSGNSTAGSRAHGGGIFASGNVTLTGSTVSGNVTTGNDANGGGIRGGSHMGLAESTVSGNVTTGINAHGGGIWIGNTVVIFGSTVTNNHANASGGGVYQANSAANDPFTIIRSIVAANTVGGSGADLVKDPQSLHTVRYSVIGTGIVPTAGGNNVLTNDPQLHPLANNGGPTQTHALMAGSPAIDAGDPSDVAGVGGVPLYDQRGAPFVRVVYDGLATDYVGLSEIKFAGKLSGAPGATTVITPTQAFASTYYATAQGPLNLINNSGLDTSSGNVLSYTHAADGIATGMWHAGGGQGTFGAAPVVADQYVVLDLGANYDLSAAYLWQMVQTGLLGRGIKEFRLLASSAAPTAADVANPPAAYNLSGFTEILGSATLFQGPTSGSVATQTFILSGAANIRQIYLDIVSNHNEPGIDIGAFEAQRVNLVVDTDVDEDDGNYAPGDFSLREAINQTNTNTGADTITFDPGFFGTPRVISVGLGPLEIRDDLMITGPGASVLTVTGNIDSHLFNVYDGETITTKKIVVIRGLNISGGGGVRGIFNLETLTVENCAISGDTPSDGGGIFNATFGALTVLNSTLIGSRALNRGGGIFNAGTLLVQNSTISGNRAVGSGGGILNAGTLTVQNSTFSDNESSYGGGISNSGPLTIDSSTISGNLTSFGGAGVFTAVGAMMVRSSTITQNHSDRSNSTGAPGGGIAVNSGVVTLHNTIVADNFRGSAATTDDDVDGGLSGSSTNNLIGTGGSGGLTHGSNGNQVGVADPGLVPLANNGGPTWTHALLAGSPAIDAGDPAIASPPMNDQRGAPFVRIANGDASGGARIDVGAYERQTLAAEMFVVTTVADELNYANGDVSLREAINSANGTDVDAVTFDPIVFGAPQVIALTLGEMGIGDALTIDARPLANNVVINAQQDSRIFNITATTGDFTLDGLTLTGGRASGDFPFTITFNGGAIRSLTSGKLALTQSTVSGNSSDVDGGGIYARGSVTLTQSTVSGNTANSSGGGIFANGALTLTQSTVSGNTVNSSGGGIFANGAVTLTQSTVAYNHASAQGGGVFQNDNDSFSISGSIVAGNTANDAGAADLAAPNTESLFVNYSLIGEDPGGIVGANNITGLDPGLGPLADNGGPTETHALLAGSQAIDIGDPSIAFNPAEFDQRGAPFVRVLSGDAVPGARIDIGAFELHPPADFDDDDDVDGADFLAWQRGLGATGAAATRANGNADNDGDVDGADLAFWKAQFGGPPPAVAAAFAAGQAARPLAATSGETQGTIGTTSIRFDARLPFRMTGSPDGPAAIVGAVAPRVLQAKSALAAVGNSAPRDAAAFAWADWLSDTRRERDDAVSMLPGNERLEKYHSDYRAAADGVFLRWEARMVHTDSINPGGRDDGKR